MSNDFDFSELEKYCKEFEKTSQEFETFLKKFLLQQAQRVVRLAKQKTPVDTGALINSWAIGSQKVVLKEKGGTSKKSGKLLVTVDFENSDITDSNIIGNLMEVEISNGMEYASYVEYGHHSYEGRFMLTIAVDTVQNAVEGRFKKEFMQFMKERGVG